MPEQPAASSPAGLDLGQATDVGRVREANEDASLVLAPTGGRPGEVLVAVADGMGGHKAGEVASALAIEALRRTGFETDAFAALGDVLRRAVERANATIFSTAAADADKEGMGTTLVCAVLDASGQVVLANVGDSRAYAVSDAARLVTSDHTWVNEQVLTGRMTERDARRSPYRNLLTRALGSSPVVEVDLFTGVRLGEQDALVLVSDGITLYLDEHDLASIVRESASAQEAAERLVEEAVGRGGADNATAVVVRRG